MPQTAAVIRASELAQFAYCARGWWLASVQGIEPSNVRELQGGQARHQQHGRLVVSYRRLRALGYVVLAVAAALIAFTVWVIGNA
jgi:CRISPR/Cas system-associated exonuclease Cas4 (RecB family)